MSRYHVGLVALFVVVWVWAAINPLRLDGWLLENLLVFLFVPIIFVVGRYFKLSNVSYTLITLFAVLHVIGSHYTYAEVPFGFTLQDWCDCSRNMYDRLVHFSFGFLLAYPAREIFMRLLRVRGFWSYYFPLDLVAATSGLFEVIEWFIVRNVDPVAGLAFLATQGDIWDAQKDMFLAILGGTLAMLIIFIINWLFNKDHWREMKDSFTLPADERPLGETRLKEYLKR